MPIKTGVYKNKQIIAVIGEGKDCTCSDCPVLYGGECLTDKNSPWYVPDDKTKE